MLIFHQFPDKKHAEDFAAAVRDTYGRETHVCDSQEESDYLDPFPFKLTPPIVLVEREYGFVTEAWPLPQLTKKFHGVFAGT